MRIVMTRECNDGRHDQCAREVTGQSRYGVHRDTWVCGCDCGHGKRHAPATVAEAYDQGIKLHPADLFGGIRRRY